MKRTPTGTSVGVDDPYAHAGPCDHVTSEGRCRFPLDHPGADPTFADRRRAADFECLVGAAERDWQDCPHYRDTSTAEKCARCGLEERRQAHEDSRPLLEAHHLVYPDEKAVSHEITVTLCRWCHAAVHDSWGRIDDDANPAPEALAAAEARRSEELSELSFESAADRFDREP
ncbi:DUF7097 family protein [Halodesulfurarchaeum formicicum]|uniref:Uncharacterized protein n=1 Tax=Halodesulfurarchaeum formicicum TaxID=1873524 RepID=A0A1J1AE56_9EURY|nr:hypothetical protein [Halodesulfurarchaeum formicicum]APE96007.1 hypothetical protein HSR6_1564 [Halodesulfurarchaeum formicicum]